MKTFDELKNEVRSTAGAGTAGQLKYRKLLDLLVAPANDQRRKDDRWDLWYFEDNTGFYLNSARSFLDKLNEQTLELQKHHKGEESQCRFNVARQHFGGFSFYLYAALESFAHEATILYGLKMTRRKVSIDNVLKDLKKGTEEWGLKTHLALYMEDPEVNDFREYRDAIMHGYVFILSGNERGFFLEQQPKAEWVGSKGLMDRPIDQFCQAAYEKVDELIGKGWVCFGKDQLT